MMNGYYKLDGKLVVPVKDLIEWARWLEFADRTVDQTRIGPILVSTVFLGLDHNFGSGLPLVFETMIFRGGDGGETWRFASWQEAEEGHGKAVAIVRAEIIEKAQAE
jgi:hypothetical protein